MLAPNGESRDGFRPSPESQNLLPNIAITARKSIRSPKIVPKLNSSPLQLPEPMPEKSEYMNLFTVLFALDFENPAAIEILAGRAGKASAVRVRPCTS
jgi:hypothetical protein